MTYQQWQDALSSKIEGTWNLHHQLPDDLEFFVLFSSIVSMSGHVGQSNYSGACAFQDAFAHYRRGQGRNAYSINIGPVSDSGFVSENAAAATALQRQGYESVLTSEVLAQLNYVLTQVAAPGELPRCQSSVGLVPSSHKALRGQDAWIEHRRLRHLASQGNGSSSGDQTNTRNGGAADIAAVIREAKHLEDAEAVICTAVVQQLSKLLATSADQILPACSLDNYGVDSLVAVELRNWIAAYLQANIPLLVLRETKSILELAGIVTRDSRYVSIKA